MRYADIDTILQPWAATRSLHIYTEYKDEEARIILVVDDAGDTYHLYIGPDPKDPSYPNTKLALVGVSLSKRGSKKHHALYRERLRFTFEQCVSLSQLSAALDTAWQRVNEWITQASHSRPNA